MQNIPVIHTIGEVRINTQLQQHGFYAIKAFAKGNIIMAFGAREVLHTPNYLTIQCSDNTHIMLAPKELQYTNHSCMPNVFFNTSTMELEALQDINVNDEFTFFYPSTEWKMDQEFSCNCGAKNCIGTIQGAYYLSEAAIHSYRFTNFIMQKLKEVNIAKRA